MALLLGTPAAAQAADALAVPASSTNDVEVVLTLALDGDPLVDSFIAHDRGSAIFAPVCALAEALSLAITCAPDRAFGFIGRESQPFVVDIQEGYVVSERKAFSAKNRAYSHNGDIFVELAALSEWLPVDFSYDKASLTIRMHAREVLPLQGLKQRQARRLPEPPPSAVAKQMEDRTSPRAALSIPTLDWASEVTWTGGGHGHGTTALNSFDLSGDLLYMSSASHLYLADERVKRADFTLFRRGEMRVGRIPLTQVAVGSIQPPYIEGVGGTTRPLYGFLLSNRPLPTSSKFLSHDVNGYLPAGWDAELFHNGVLVAYQPPTRDGMYHFVNQQVYYGVNMFKVVMHGPFGEQRESEEVFLSDAVTPTGKLHYTVSAGWETTLTEQDLPSPDREASAALTADFGIARNLTGSAMLLRLNDRYGVEQEFVGVAARSAVGFTLLSLDLIQSFSPTTDQAGQLWTFRSSSSDVFGMNLEILQRFFHNFSSPMFPCEWDPLLSTTLLRGTSSMFVAGIGIPYSVTLQLAARKSGEVEGGSQWRLSGGWNGWNGSLGADISYLQGQMASSAILQVSTRVDDISIRGQSAFEFAPTFKPLAINLNADKDLGWGIQANTMIIHDPDTNVFGGRVGITKRYGLVGYTVSASANSAGVYGVDVGVRASAAADSAHGQVLVSAEPLSPFGMIAVAASVADAENPAGRPLAEAGFLVNGVRAVTVTGSKRWPVIANLQPDVPVDVTVDLSTLQDPFMVPLQDGCRIVPRAGVVSTCTFTMTTGGEIDGMVLVKMGKADEVPLKGVNVDLVGGGGSGNAVRASTRSQDSGYYLFKAVKPGKYRIVIPESEVARLKVMGVTPIEVVMPVGGDMLSAKDFHLVPAAAPQ